MRPALCAHSLAVFLLVFSGLGIAVSAPRHSPSSVRPDRRSERSVRIERAASPQAIPSTPDDIYWSDQFGTPGLGWVYSIATFQDELVVGGLFTERDGHPTNNLARWDGTTWRTLGAGVSSSPPGSSNVEALQVHLGQLIVAGSFDSAGGAAAANVARWDGSAWSPMGALPVTQDLQEFGGVLHAATRDGLFRWNGSSWVLVLPGWFDDLLLFNGELVAVGFFDVPGGAAEVAAWNGTSWTILAHQTNGWALCGVVYLGELYIGGEFDTIDGILVHGLARWTGSTWQPLTGGLGANYVLDLLVMNDRLVLVGSMSAALGQPAGRVVTWDGTTWSTLGDFAAGSGEAKSACLWNNELYAGGTFQIAGPVAVWGLTRWNGAQWTTVGPLEQNGVGSVIDRFCTWNDRLVALGSFSAAGNAACPDNLASFDGSAWTAIAMPRQGVSYPELAALGTFQGDLVVGGHFNQVAGQAASCIAAWDGTAWHAFGAGLNAEPLDFAIYEGQLIAAGRFTASGSQPLQRVARWDGLTWQPLGSGFNNDVSALRVHGGHLFAGGKFTASGSSQASYLAVWDGSTWLPVGAGLNGNVNALESYAGELVAGGAFTTAGGLSAPHIARWNGIGWSPLGQGFTLTIMCVHAYGGELYAARQGNPYLSALLTGESSAIARWNGSVWNVPGSGMTAGNWFPFGPRIHTMATHGGYLYLGGDFAGAGYKPASYVTRWESPGPSAVAEVPPVPPRLVAWPNPARGPVSFRAALPQSDTVSLDILDVQGRRVRHIVTRMLPAGTHLLSWDGRDDAGRMVVPGVYVGRLVTHEGAVSARVVRVQ